MAVFRVERTSDYTVMSNYHLRDKRLSLKAKGLLSQMLSLPEDWDYTLAGLCYINRESKDAIRTAIHELEQAGYIHRRQTTDSGGKFAGKPWPPAAAASSTSSGTSGRTGRRPATAAAPTSIRPVKPGGRTS